MKKQAFLVTGLGYGDEGKGTITHWLSCRHHAHTVIRTGGAQARHMVTCQNGQTHGFSQFGSGTLRGSATHLSQQMVIDPHAILKEGESLVYERGIRGVFEMMTIHEDALVIAPFQAIVGRVRELLRGPGRHGSVGIGIGETILDAERLGTMAIRAKDLLLPDIRKKLEVIQQYKLTEFETLKDQINFLPSGARSVVQSEITELEDSDTVQWAVERFTELVKRVRIVDTDYVIKHILSVAGTVVVEGSQGVLLDRYCGFHPYTTKVRTTPLFAKHLLQENRYDGEITSLGVLRAYHTRHGVGPFVSESALLTEKLPDMSNREHAWQGNFRVGSFDMVAAKYAIETVGAESIDGLVITCLDRISSLGHWPVCKTYKTPRATFEEKSFFRSKERSIKSIVAPTGKNTAKQLARQEKLGQLLAQCSPQLTKLHFSTPKDLIRVCVREVEMTTGVPVVVVSVGATESDKIEIKTGGGH